MTAAERRADTADSSWNIKATGGRCRDLVFNMQVVERWEGGGGGRVAGRLLLFLTRTRRLVG